MADSGGSGGIKVASISRVSINVAPSTITAGSSVSASCSVYGTLGQTTYVWQYQRPGGTNWSATGNYASSATITLSKVGTFGIRCYVKTTLNGTTAEKVSDPFYVTVTDPIITPKIYETPSVTPAGPLKVPQNSTLTLFCSASGNGTLSYRWDNDDGRISGQTNASYAVPTDTISIKTYRCVVMCTTGASYAAVKESNSVEVEVVQAPDKPHDITISGGGTYSVGAAVTLTCSAQGNGTLSYAWNKIGADGVPRPTGSTGRTYTPSTSEAGTTYYTCTVTNELNGFKALATSNAAMVKLEDGPTVPNVNILGGGSYLADGSAVTLTCNASATNAGVFTYQWQYKLPDATAWITPEGATNATYSTSATKNGIVQYRCLVTNTKGTSFQTGSGTTAINFLLPPDKPTATISGQSTVYKGGRAIITCTAAGNGTITYQWANEQGRIDGETNATYSVPTDKAGQIYDIYCIVTNKVLTESKTVETNHVTVEVLDTPDPEITSQSIASADYAINATANAMTIAATSAVGSIIYHWQGSTDNSTWTDITGQTGQSFTPSTAKVGTTYYRCRVVNSYLGSTKEVLSNVATIRVTSVPKPSFTSAYDMRNAYYYLNQQANTLNASATSSAGSISYKWQFSYDGANWQNAGISNPTATPTTSSLGTVYYRCIVTNSLNGETATIYSDTAVITVSGAPVPTLNRDNTDVTCYIGDSSASMAVDASVSAGTLSYQWHQLSGGQWIPVAGATATSYHPPTETVGATKYLCAITNNYQGLVANTTSSAATFTVLETPKPQFTNESTLKSAAYKQGDAANVLDATATVPQGTITYQWQKRNAESGAWEDISGQTNAQFTPSTDDIGSETYRCVAQNTLFQGTASTETASISVSVDYAAAPVPEFAPEANVADAEYYIGDTAQPMNASATSDAGEITYQWQQSGTGGAWTNIVGATSATYTPQTADIGSVYYRCQVSNTYNDDVSTLYTNEALVVVDNIPSPYFEDTESLKTYTYWQGASAAAMTVSAAAEAGTVTCVWQKSTDDENWTDVTAPGTNAYTPSTETLGTAYYRVVATNRLNEQTAQTISRQKATVSVMEAQAPTITGQPQSANYTVMATANPLQTEYTSVTEPVAFQWQQSADGNTWSDIPGATMALYVPSTATAESRYYRVQMYAGAPGHQVGATSEAAVITVTVGEPGFLRQPQSADYNLRANPQPLDATASAPGCVLTYQWQQRENASAEWRNIIGAEQNTYYPPTSPRGSTQYRCIVTASNNDQTVTVYSNVATITVSGGQAPIFERRLSNSTYSEGDAIYPLNGTATSQDTADITYQWYWSRDNETFYPVDGGTSPVYIPNNAGGGSSYYYVIATAKFADGTTAQSRSNTAVINIVNVSYTFGEAWRSYLKTLKTNYVKLARLEFLQPDGSVAFALDNNPLNKRSGAFIQSGQLTVNLQNGKRRTATVTLANLDGEFDYNVNKVWFGQQILLSEGLILPNGQEFYLPQGVFYIREPEEKVLPNMRAVTYNLEDKWSYLDGTLFGNLEGIYEIPLHTNVFDAIQSVLDLDRGNGVKVDAEKPIYTNYYNGQTTVLPDGTEISDLLLPYTYRNDSENGTYADIVLEMSNILAAWVGYDATGRLRVDPSQDDILDTNKPIQWEFRPDETQFLGATYTVKNTDVYNDVVIVGESLSGYGYVAGRAQNRDPRSDTNVNLIGIKTHKESAAGFYSDKQCENLAVFRLKRQTALQKSVSIQSAQLFHINENQLVTIRRPDKPGAPLERHLVTGFTRPIAQTGVMRIDATSVNDFVSATVIPPQQDAST